MLVRNLGNFQLMKNKQALIIPLTMPLIFIEILGKKSVITKIQNTLFYSKLYLSGIKAKNEVTR